MRGQRVLTDADEYAWAGLASTAFHVDPIEEIIAMFCTHLMPSSTPPLPSRLRALVSSAVVG